MTITDFPPISDTVVVGADDFRRAMGAVATPVTVVTTSHGEQLRGATVSAFASLSLDPPMVLVSLDRGSQLLAGLRPGDKLGVNVLSEEQSDDALRFARRGTDKFAHAGYHFDHNLPRLDRSAGWLACEVSNLIAGGDHIIVTALVEHADTTGRAPMVYHSRSFGGFSTVE